MADPKKQEYYRAKREQRLAYQSEYYKRNRSSIIRRREVNKEIDPEEHAAISEYNRNYYLKNRDRIVEKRRQKRLEDARIKIQDAGSGSDLS